MRCTSCNILIGSDKGLSPARYQAITLTNAGLLLIRSPKYNSFIQRNPLENDLCKMPQCVNDGFDDECYHGRYVHKLVVVMACIITVLILCIIVHQLLTRCGAMTLYGIAELG